MVFSRILCPYLNLDSASKVCRIQLYTMYVSTRVTPNVGVKVTKFFNVKYLENGAR